MSKYKYFDISETARANIWANEQDGPTLEKEIFSYIKDLEAFAKERIPSWNDDSPTFAPFKRTPLRVSCALTSLRVRSDELDALIWNEGLKRKNKRTNKPKNRY